MRPRIYDGSGQPAPECVTLTAGALRVEHEAGTLRYLRLGNHEIVRGIYAAVRDHNWGTIPAVLRDLRIDQRADSFTITFTSEHQQGDLHFVWRGTIEGTAESTVTFRFDGEALTSFRRNRIGFCVLHPMTLAGQAVEIEHVDGTTEQGAFPQAISPHQPYFDLRALTHEVIPGVRAEVRMEGDTFEMEDQRNWTDASFKTYCTPLGLPFPALIEAGTQISQTITVRLIGDVANVEIRASAPTLHLDPSVSNRLSDIGLCAAADRLEHDALEFQRLSNLIGHVRVDLVVDDGLEQRLGHVLNDAWASRWWLELAVHLTENVEGELSQLRGLLEKYRIRARLLLLDAGRLVTSPATLTAAQRIFADYPHTLDIGVSTNGYFTQLNRNRPDPDLKPAFVAYSVNPQVHAFDNASLIETLPVLGETVKSARQIVPEAKIAVTPITLKIGFNPDATAPDAPTPPGQLPRRVDPRQMSLFGAGWTLGAIASLALAGADSLTFYETTGWLGVMERATGSPLPDLFPSIPGGVFPMYHVFADVIEFVGSKVLGFTSSHPLQFSGLALASAAGQRLLVANHTEQMQTLTITGISGAWQLKALDEHSADFAMRDPEGYRAAPGNTVTAGSNGLTLDLLPYAVVRLDQKGTA
ncbi:MAG: hypothetical protein IPK17_33865 [Chloroflexi bacterium]|uniref:hypothetical protein n=1 Tax=Candidatus Flexifilum breve TaxID=3140694 RepID=UPI00313498C8|nr:hypothetical protein [Chloroflexota bacterium]